MSLPADVSRQDRCTVVTLHGELDFATIREVRALLHTLCLSPTPGHLLVDLSSLAHLDSSGLGLLVGAHKRALDRGEQLVLVCPERLRRPFRITGLEQVLTMYASLPEALAHASAASPKHRSRYDDVSFRAV